MLDLIAALWQFSVPYLFWFFKLFFLALAFTAPFWLPIALAITFALYWINYVRYLNFTTLEHILLEIKLPSLIDKSPAAMEIALTNIMISAGETTSIDTYIFGKTRPWYSLEIASFEGQIHFYIWTRKQYKDVVEAQLYAQYPGIEIVEVPDYVTSVPRVDFNTMNLFSIEYKLKEPDPFPIKTYVDFGLDKDPKEEYKIDPLTGILEFMGNMGPGEQFWLQIGIRAHKKMHKHGTYFGTTDIVKEGEKLIEKLEAEFKKAAGTDKEGNPLFRFPQKYETDTLALIADASTLPSYDCLVRVVYTAKKENFKPQPRIHPMLGLFRSFKGANSLEIGWLTGFTYEQFGRISTWMLHKVRSHALEEYQARSFFYSAPSILRHIPFLSWLAPHHAHPYVMNVRELATLWHFPGGTAATPGLERILSKKSAAPSNLPK